MPAAPVHHTPIDDTKAWDGPGAEKRFDKKASDFDKFYAWVDKGEGDKAADGSDKEDGWGPHHDVNAEGVPGDANLKGVEAAMAALNGAHGTTSVIPDGDRQGVWDHLAAHYEDAGIDKKDIPELKASTEPVETKARKPRARRELGHRPEYRLFNASNVETRAGSGANAGLVEVTGTVIVYETPYEVYDMWGSFTETIHFGCAAPVLAADPDVRFLVNHKDMPLARSGAEASLTLTDTPEGLNVTALIDPRQSAANDLVVALERGTVTQMSVGMEVDPVGDVWSGEDDYGMPNVRDIYRLANIFDTSAVTFPASPTTTLELAQRMWAGVPVESRERTRRLWAVAKEGRQGHALTQHDSDALLHVLETLYTVDPGDEPVADVRSAPTAQDANVSKAIIAAHQSVAAALAAQSKDPDNNTDPVDKQVWNALSSAQDALTTAMKAQAKDGAPDAEKPEDKSASEYQADPDGTEGGSGDTTSGSENGDGTGFRSIAIDIDLDLARLRRRPVSA